MPFVESPQNPGQLAEALRGAASRNHTVSLSGNDTKRRMAGPAQPADESISTAGLGRVLQYEPRDLTISVEAGLPWREFSRLTAENRQMVPLDPPFAASATVGGVIASNSSGPRRRLFGTARDHVIGMRFATVEGKLVQSGGMVVKNVAGLDMAKLMIGSFGTLAAIASVNFKLSPMPEAERSFLLPFESAAAAIAARNRLLAGALQPAAIDLLNPAAGATLGKNTWLLAVRTGGNPGAIERGEREIAQLSEGVALDDSGQTTLWSHIEEFTPRFLETHPDGAVGRASCTLKELEAVVSSTNGPVLARAGTGVCYCYFDSATAAAAWVAEAVGRGWKAVIEFSPEKGGSPLDLWPCPGGDLEVMKRVKQLFDPGSLLNRGRLYRRI
jgi:glycolate oxidase FAD binding subunit